MPDIHLSTGEAVTLKDRLPHKAELAYGEACDAGRREDGSVPPSVEKRALDAALQVVLGRAAGPVTREWLEDLPMEDYDLLSEALIRLTADTTARIRER